MFNRSELKANAKLALKRNYWMGFLVSILVGLVGGGTSFGSGRFNFNLNNANGGNSIEGAQQSMQQLQDAANGNTQALQNFVGQNGGLIAAVAGGAFIFALIIGLAWAFFVTTPAELGLARFFVATREQQNPVDFSYALYGFKSNYLKQAWAFFSTSLIVGLWSLIGVIPVLAATILTAVTKEQSWMALSALMLPCLIPAMIKSYQYKMAPYILANNSSISGKRVRELSTVLTDGNKWNLFVLDLSFLGWCLLGLLVCGIGILFVIPYINATYAETYTYLKANAMQTKGISSDEELPSLAGAAV